MMCSYAQVHLAPDQDQRALGIARGDSIAVHGPSLRLADAIFTNRQGRFTDRTIENQQYRASGLNLIIAAIAYWNTLYLERAADHLRYSVHQVDETLLAHVSPMGWAHIGLNGDYLWENASAPRPDRYRPLHDPSARLQLVA